MLSFIELLSCPHEACAASPKAIVHAVIPGALSAHWICQPDEQGKEGQALQQILPVAYHLAP
jgi:hypothetical protein